MDEHKGRFITLLGDDIDRGPIHRTLDSDDVKYGGLAALGSGVIESFQTENLRDVFGQAAEIGKWNALSVFIARDFIEPMALGYLNEKKGGVFINSKTFNSLCIDRCPDAHSLQQSLDLYKKKAGGVKTMYLGFAGLTAGPCLGQLALAALNLSPDGVGAINESLSSVSFVTRMAQGYARFKNVQNGTHAIVPRPKHNEPL